MSDDKSSPDALKAAAKARLLEKFERDWADAQRLAAAYPEMFAILADAAPQSSHEPQTNEPQGFDGTVKGLIERYKNDPDSNYKKIGFRTRQNYDWYLRRIENDLGSERVADLDAHRIKNIHESWKATGIASAHGFVTMLRVISTFGATWLKSPGCRELKITLSGMEFQMPEERKERLTADHAKAIRRKAHELGRPSIALAQAFQFDCMLSQTDAIGEWVPNSEPGVSDITDGNEKWLRGLRWSEIDENLVLRHTTSTRKHIEFDLRGGAPMVMEELALLGTLPTTGPVIISERYGKPYISHEFRHKWREIAQAAGVPDKVRNMDSRAPARLDRLAPSRRHLRRQETE